MHKQEGVSVGSYLTVEDILHTWYFTKSMNVTLYAITSGEIAEKSKMSVCDWIEQQQEIMEKGVIIMVYM